MKTKNKNALELILKQLNVKFTSNYASKLYQENPYKNSLSGIGRMLADYRIETKAIRLNDKNKIHSLAVPLLTTIHGEATLIHTRTNDRVSCIWREQEIEVSIEEFMKVWDGSVLLVRKTEKTAEPSYKENYVKQLFRILQEKTLYACILLSALIGFINNGIYTRPGLLLLLLVNLAGGYIGYLLVQKQLYIQNDHADKICSLFKKGSCDDVLFSPAAKFMGIIGWSEVGFGYFISNTLVVTLFPQLIPWLALINACALPYSLWSVWYQKFKVKQWCPLCLIVQVLLWTVFILNLVFGFISFPSFIATQLLLTGIIYVLPFVLINLGLPKLISEKQLQYTREDINELRMKPWVFEALLKQQPHYEVDLSVSQIIWGNKESDILITILTNPHCGPCADLHKHIEKLLATAEDKIGVQYIFSSFTDDFDSGKFLIAAYLSETDLQKKKEIYTEWFEKGKYEKEYFFKKYEFDIHSTEVEAEIDKHKNWRERADIHATPTILINGYELPYYYGIEDVVYFTGLKIE